MEWISVKDRLPEKGVKILTWVINGKEYFNGEEYEAVDRMIGEGEFVTDFFGYGEVTHWMPLPEPPK